jgi:hypothetical protein
MVFFFLLVGREQLDEMGVWDTFGSKGLENGDLLFELGLVRRNQFFNSNQRLLVLRVVSNTKNHRITLNIPLGPVAKNYDVLDEAEPDTLHYSLHAMDSSFQQSV